MSARQEMLARIAAALGPAPATVDVPRGYITTSEDDRATILERFVERVEDYRASVTRTHSGSLAAALAEALADARSIVVAHDLDLPLPDGVEVHRDNLAAPLGVDRLDTVDGVVTTAAVGIADTGTIVLDAGPGQGRRAITLVPDLHVCVVAAAQVVATVPEAVRRLDATRPQTWISGPSATSDIELDRVEGVHGPRTLRVILLQ